MWEEVNTAHSGFRRSRIDVFDTAGEQNTRKDDEDVLIQVVLVLIERDSTTQK